MKILNLGCGSKISGCDEVVNIDWSPLLRIRENPVVSRLAPLFLDRKRLERFLELKGNILVYDLSRGIPFPDNSVDVVYHSHLLEHLDRALAPRFMTEVLRVLRPGGIHRIVVPDWERLCRAYLSNLEACDMGLEKIEGHERYIEGMLEQSVRREASGTAIQRPRRRFLENFFLGDARERGETHQWMYDRLTLATLLSRAGFDSPRQEMCNTSSIPSWSFFQLDMSNDGREFNPGSLYMEAIKP